MLKQAASAAASSSSGLEPSPFSNREPALYWPHSPVCPLKSPCPLSPPFQFAVALLVGIVWTPRAGCVLSRGRRA